MLKLMQFFATLLLSVSTASLAGNKVDPIVLQELSSSTQTGLVVHLSPAQGQTVQKATDDVLRSLGPKANYSIRYQFDHLALVSLNGDANTVSELALHPTVQYISSDGVVQNFMSEALTASNTQVLIDPISIGGYGLSGDGVSIAVIDGGYDRTNPTLTAGVDQNNERCWDADGNCPAGTGGNGFASWGPGAAADNGTGHGTRMVAIALDAAPDVTVIAIRANTRTDRLKALEWIIDNPGLGIDIVSMSFGIALRPNEYSEPDKYYFEVECDCKWAPYTDTNSYPYTDPAIRWCDASDRNQLDLHHWTYATRRLLLEQDISMVAAVGNYGENYSYGDEQAPPPACLSSAIGVAASYDDDFQSPPPFYWAFDPDQGLFCQDPSPVSKHQIPCFSSLPVVLTDVLAPGAIITTSALGGGTMDTWGTSEATPQVAACLSLLHEDGIIDPFELREAISHSATQSEGFPVLDCEAAWEWAFRPELDLSLAIETYDSGIGCWGGATVTNVGHQPFTSATLELQFSATGSVTSTPPIELPSECTWINSDSLLQCSLSNFEPNDNLVLQWVLNSANAVDIRWEMVGSDPLDPINANNLATLSTSVQCGNPPD